MCLANPVKAYPVANLNGSISLPEIEAPVFATSPFETASNISSSVPSLSSLLNFTPSSSMPISCLSALEKKTNDITDSMSLPAIPLIKESSLQSSASSPAVIYSLEKANINTIAPPITHQGCSLPIDISFQDIPSLSDPNYEERAFNFPSPEERILHEESPQVTVFEEHQWSAPDGEIYPPVISLVSQDDLSGLITHPYVIDEAPSPSLFTPQPDAYSPALPNDFTLFVGPPVVDENTADRTPTEPLFSSSMSNQSLSDQLSSPLSSPPATIMQKHGDNFRNTFDGEVLKRPASPYNKRLRSASNNPPTRMECAVAPRAVSVSSRLNQPLDADLAILKLPPPPKSTFKVPEIVVSSTKRRRGRARQTSDTAVDTTERLQIGGSRRRSSASLKVVDKEN
ncbi:hypothetical protein H0H81_009193 [Sphagnurus paluster]|uniref:Uncharacterized protein n=1 Tax=Sphagnurus paluster TaxID=117069 RepID=A0A9P7K433_9AGAR|nr:hypothetical protein H0H81_009193 [Sphagnurus paluster]